MNPIVMQIQVMKRGTPYSESHVDYFKVIAASLAQPEEDG